MTVGGLTMGPLREALESGGELEGREEGAVGRREFAGVQRRGEVRRVPRSG